MQTATPTRSPKPRCCRICYLPMRGRSHERCQLLGYDNRQYAFRQEEDEDTKSSSPDDGSSSGASSSTKALFIAHAQRSYASPPSTPPSETPSSASGSSFSDAFSALTTSAEKGVRLALAPPPPVYPPTVLSDASWELPETGSYHHVNKRYVHFIPIPIPPAPPSVVGSLAPTEPVSTADVLTEASVNLRGASPGPSAHAFMAQSDDGSVGPCLSERIKLNKRRNAPPSAASVMTARPGKQFSGTALRLEEHMLGEGSTSTMRKPFWASDVSVTEKKYDYWPGNMPTPAPTPSRPLSDPFPITTPPSDKSVEFAVTFVEDTATFIEGPVRSPSALKIGLALQFGMCFVAFIVGGYVSKRFL